MALAGRSFPIRAHITRVRGTMSFSSTFTEGLIGTDTDTNQKIKPLNVPAEGLVGTDSIIRSLLRSISEGLIGTDSVIRTSLRSLSEGLVGTDTLSRLWVHGQLLTEGLVGTDTIRKLLNGSDILWTHVTRAAASTWTKGTRAAASTWTHITKG